MRTIQVNVYEFKELNARSQQRALDIAMETSTDHDWWNCVYDHYMSLVSYKGAIVINKINGFNLNNYKVDLDISTDLVEDIDEDTLHDLIKELKGDILKELQDEYDHITSTEYLIDMVESNEWMFYEDGKLA